MGSREENVVCNWLCGAGAGCCGRCCCLMPNNQVGMMKAHEQDAVVVFFGGAEYGSVSYLQIKHLTNKLHLFHLFLWCVSIVHLLVRIYSVRIETYQFFEI